MATWPGHTRNTIFLGGVEAFWGLGMNLVSLGAVIPVFLEGLGASNAAIALLPALSALGVGLPQAFSGTLTRRGGSLRARVLWLHVAAPLPLALVAAGLWSGGVSPVWLVLGGWGAFYALVGTVFPLWLDFMAGILDPERRGRAFGFIFFTQTLAGAAGVTAAGYLLGHSTAPQVYAALFLSAALLMAGGSFLFLGTAGGAPDEPVRPGGVDQHLRAMWGALRRSRWMLPYLCGRWVVRGAYPLILHFYAVFAVAERGMSPSAAAILGTAALLGQAFAGIGAGWLGDRFGHKAAVLIGQGGLASAALLLVTPVPDAAIYLAAVLTGAFLATEYTSQTNWVIDLAGPHERRNALGLVGFLLTPSAVLAPLAGGWIMDSVGFRPVFGAVGLLVLGAMAWEIRLVPTGRERI
ncbi:MAG: MFS transporter [Acidobacteriota bacterium]